MAEFYRDKGNHIITAKTEHKAVLDTCKRLERQRAERIDELKLLRLTELPARGDAEKAAELAELDLE